MGYKVGIKAWDDADYNADMTAQPAENGTNMAAAKAAEIVKYRAKLANAKALGLSPAQFIFALQELGTGGI